jgi:hypothetical protein
MTLIGQTATMSINAEQTLAFFTVEYNSRLVDAIRTLPGRHWDNDNKRWSVPIAC